LKLEQQFPEDISAARGKGLMCAFDLKDHETRDRLKNKLYDEASSFCHVARSHSGSGLT
jgi:L-lysine 6-transaminase